MFDVPMMTIQQCQFHIRYSMANLSVKRGSPSAPQCTCGSLGVRVQWKFHRFPRFHMKSKCHRCLWLIYDLRVRFIQLQEENCKRHLQTLRFMIDNGMWILLDYSTAKVVSGQRTSGKVINPLKKNSTTLLHYKLTRLNVRAADILQSGVGEG